MNTVFFPLNSTSKAGRPLRSMIYGGRRIGGGGEKEKRRNGEKEEWKEGEEKGEDKKGDVMKMCILEGLGSVC